MSKSYDPDNIFARILRGEIPAKRVHETEWALAFSDIRPAAPVHVLVIPKQAYVDYSDFIARAPADEVVGFFKAVGETATLLGVEDEGYRLQANQGPHSGQEVPHFHIHILAGRPLGPLLPPSPAA